MKARWFVPAALAVAPLLLPMSASALTVYPIDRATMLTGGKFDFKVEFDSQVKPEQIHIRINGKDYRDVWKQDGEFIANEDGLNASSLVIKNVSLPIAGDYRIDVSAGDDKGVVSWNVYQTPSTRQYQERDSVYRRWPLCGSSHRCQSAFQRDNRRKSQRASGYR